ncbi:hypothetical protein DL769_003898 [Monosporascus sp. CRB-8-3]|nr:hypothetical protein DL769_003898 [Monosporascus sp. CRB-8-3]
MLTPAPDVDETDYDPPSAAALRVVIPDKERQSQFVNHLPRFYKDFKPEDIVSFEKGEPVPLKHIRWLGSGSFGGVEEVQHRFSGFRLARKRFHRRTTREMRERDFRTEWENLRHIRQHRHIIPLAGAYSEERDDNQEQQFYLLFELADCNLTNYLLRQSDQRDILYRLFGCLCVALKFIRPVSRHKDIKPDNILIRNSNVLLSDFGSAHTYPRGEKSSTHRPHPGAVTWKYSAPEVLAGAKRNSRADVFSLGCVFSEIIGAFAGETPGSILGESGLYGDSVGITAIKNWLSGVKTKQTQEDDDLLLPIEWSSKMVNKNPDDRPEMNSFVGEMVKECLRRRKLGVYFCEDCCEEYKQSGLLEAAAEGDDKVIQLLLREGVSVDTPTIGGETALQRAAEKGHTAVVRQLLDGGADVNTTDGGGRTALQLAADKGYEAVVQQLLDEGADVNVTDGGGWTALLLAAEKGHDVAVSRLLEAGADVDAEDAISGQTALHRAAAKGHTAVVRQLLDRGADVNTTDGGGRTALQLATEKGHEAMVQLLCQKRAYVDSGREAVGW